MSVTTGTETRTTPVPITGGLSGHRMEKRICFEQKLCGSLEFEAKRTEKNETDDFDITIFILITVQSTEQ